MAFNPAQVTVGTSPVELTIASSPGSLDGSSIVVKAPDAATLWVGPAGVTPSIGWPIDAGAKEGFDLEYGEKLYGVLATGSGTAYVLRFGI